MADQKLDRYAMYSAMNLARLKMISRKLEENRSRAPTEAEEVAEGEAIVERDQSETAKSLMVVIEMEGVHRQLLKHCLSVFHPRLRRAQSARQQIHPR